MAVDAEFEWAEYYDGEWHTNLGKVITLDDVVRVVTSYYFD